MKKMISCILFVCLFAANIGAYAEETGKLSVISTIFAPYDFVREIAGEHADVTMLLPPGSESHSYEPTPQDIIKIQNCDVFIHIGGPSDAWVDKVFESMDISNMKIIALTNCVEVVEEETVEGMETEHEHDHADYDDHDEHEDHAHEEGVELDEHVWTAPKNAMRIVEAIADALCDIDAANADIYKQNAVAYLARLDELDSIFQSIVADANRKTLVFGDRFPFRYFADAYGLEYFAAFPGCATETEASAATVAFLINKVRDEEIPVVFHVELSNKKMANVISESTNAKVLLFHACHNVTKDEMAQNIAYLELMTQNAENLKEALK